MGEFDIIKIAIGDFDMSCKVAGELVGIPL